VYNSEKWFQLVEGDYRILSNICLSAKCHMVSKLELSLHVSDVNERNVNTNYNKLQL